MSGGMWWYDWKGNDLLISPGQSKSIRMGQKDKLLERILRGTSDTNISFTEVCTLLRRLGFDERIRSSHHIFTKEGVEEILNLQSKGANAKPYQIKQVRNLFLKYKLGGDEDDQI
jgi:hypothetical protein